MSPRLKTGSRTTASISTRLQCMSHGDGVADREKAYVIPPRFQSELLQGEHRIHPGTADDALNTETLAAQIRRVSYLRRRHQFPAHPARYGGEHFYVDTLRCTAPSTDTPEVKATSMFSSYQTRYQSRPAANQNGLRFDAVLSEDSLFLRDPEAERAAAERCGADLDSNRSRRAEHQAGNKLRTK